jgi:hypothetical protein
MFSWQLLLKRLPARANLLKRGALQGVWDPGCVCCGEDLELEDHFLICVNLLVPFWYGVFKWVGVFVVLPGNSQSVLQILAGLVKKGKSLKGLLLIWHLVVWLIWRARNDCIFSSKTTLIADTLDVIIVELVFGEKIGTSLSFL